MGLLLLLLISHMVNIDKNSPHKEKVLQGLHWFWKFFLFFIVVQVQLSPFSPHHSPQLQILPPDPTLPWFCLCVLYRCSWKPFPIPSPPIIPSHIPSGYCQFVLNFNVSGYILLAYLFYWLGLILEVLKGFLKPKTLGITVLQYLIFIFSVDFLDISDYIIFQIVILGYGL